MSIVRVCNNHSLYEVHAPEKKEGALMRLPRIDSHAERLMDLHFNGLGLRFLNFGKVDRQDTIAIGGFDLVCPDG